MPWADPLANSSDLKRCIRDLVALPAAWQNYDMRQIGSSIVAAHKQSAENGASSIIEGSEPFVSIKHDGMGLGTVNFALDYRGARRPPDSGAESRGRDSFSLYPSVRWSGGWRLNEPSTFWTTTPPSFVRWNAC
jgi:hypothetical protein